MEVSATSNCFQAEVSRTNSPLPPGTSSFPQSDSHACILGDRQTSNLVVFHFEFGSGVETTCRRLQHPQNARRKAMQQRTPMLTWIRVPAAFVAADRDCSVRPECKAPKSKNDGPHTCMTSSSSSRLVPSGIQALQALVDHPLQTVIPQMNLPPAQTLTHIGSFLPHLRCMNGRGR